MLSPYQTRGIRPKPKQEQNVFDLSALIKTIDDLRAEIESVKTLKEELKQDKRQILSDHQSKLDEMDNMLQENLSSVHNTLEEVLRKEPIVGVHFNQPKDGKDGKNGQDAFVDEKAIAERAAKLIKVPEVKVPKIDHEEIIKKVFDELDKGKRKLSHKHIGDFTDGLEQTIRPIRSLVAGFRGGGDVVVAGTNINITTDSNGKKVINFSGVAGSREVPVGAVNGVNQTFTVGHIPDHINVDGATYFEGYGYSRVDLTLTITVPPTGHIISFY